MVGTEIKIWQCAIKFFRIGKCVNYFQYIQQKLKMIIMPAYFVLCSVMIITRDLEVDGCPSKENLFGSKVIYEFAE